MIKRKRYLFVLTILLTAIIAGCPVSKHESCEDVQCDIFGDYVDPAVTAIGGAIDDQSGSLFAATSQSRYASTFRLPNISLFIDEAWAAVCARPSVAACINETKYAEYAACAIDETPFFINGMVRLAYTGTPICGFTAVGDSVTRTMNVSRTILDSGSVTTSSDNKTDFRGIVIGGGTKLTITDADTYNLDILGVNKVILNNTMNVDNSHDLFLRTTAPISVTGGLSRNGRIINGGALEVIPNEYYVYTLIPNNLSYTAGCCYPIAGSISFTADGPNPGTGTITFSSCGTATVKWDRDSSPYDVSLVSCE